MKIYISADMEGITGVIHIDQLIPGKPDYEDSRIMMTRDVNAAIEGAVEAGATEILVNDSHGGMRNILLDRLNPAAKLLSGDNKKLMMMEGIDDTFDAAIFIGYHVRANSFGVRAHTISGQAFTSIKINGVEIGETELNAALAGCYGVPLIMVSGDDCLRKQVHDFNPYIEFAVTKEYHGKQSAVLLPPTVTHELIRQTTKDAIGKIHKFKPCVLNGPLEVEIKFNNSIASYAEAAQFVPKTKRISPDTVLYTADNPVEAVGIITTMALLAAAVSKI